MQAPSWKQTFVWGPVRHRHWDARIGDQHWRVRQDDDELFRLLRSADGGTSWRCVGHFIRLPLAQRAAERMASDPDYAVSSSEGTQEGEPVP